MACLPQGRPFLDDVLPATDELAANTVRHTGSGRAGGSFTVEALHGPRGRFHPPNLR